MARRSLTILTSHNLPKIRQSKKLGRRLLVPLTAKGPRCWITALIILVLATTGSSYVYEELNLTSARSYFFQRLLEWGPRPAVPKFVSILLVEDDEYWKGELAGRRPIKREYLHE